MNTQQPVTVIVHRRVKSGRQREFEDAMREFIGFALAHPGHSEIINTDLHAFIEDVRLGVAVGGL